MIINTEKGLGLCAAQEKLPREEWPSKPSDPPCEPGEATQLFFWPFAPSLVVLPLAMIAPPIEQLPAPVLTFPAKPPCAPMDR
jgi:hypothetical protein